MRNNNDRLGWKRQGNMQRGLSTTDKVIGFIFMVGAAFLLFVLNQ